ncbi:hypothetical protein C8K36_102445 [Rhodococcus sp. OK519]|uniref:hypothetical protein n=1 Tax=Rhodococcus sp. OK519 TaxID=2135729 RepID=UPI000D372382|nr:hypothetical protein C8K36_102445 [Rhodococcus sp. OK519]
MGTVRKITPKQDVDLWDQFCSEALGEEYVKPEPYVIPLSPPIVIEIPETVGERLELQARLNAMDDATEQATSVIEGIKIMLSVLVGDEIDRLWAALEAKPVQVTEKLFDDIMAHLVPKKAGVGGDDVPGGSVGSSD